MRKISILIFLFVFFPTNVNAQGVERSSYCIELGGPGSLSFFGCESIWRLDARMCWDRTFVSNKSRVVVQMTNFYVEGIAEVDGEIIPFKNKPWKFLTITPNETTTISLRHDIESKLFNARLVVRVHVSVTQDGAVVANVDHVIFECYDYQDD